MTGYTKVDEIIERVLDTFQYDDLDYYMMIRHINDALLLIGVFEEFIPKVVKIKVSEYKAELPCDVVYINQLRDCITKRTLYTTANTFHLAKDNVLNDNGDTYLISGNHLHFNFEKGEIELSYQGMALDEKGFPLIPSNISFVKAVEFYLLEKIGQMLYLKDKLSGDKFQYIQQESSWYMAQAQNSSKVPSPEKMELIKNILKRIVNDPKERDYNYTSATFNDRIGTQPMPHTRRIR